MKTFRILLVGSTALLTANFTPAQTWTQTSAPSNHWQCIASSADGSQLVAVATSAGFGPGPIYISTNSGTTWTLSSAPSNTWTSVASSADGSKLVAVSDGPIYASTNSGMTWTLTSAPNEYWGSVASSADGSKLVAGATGSFPNASPPGTIYTSTNFGATWTQQTNAPNSNYSWYSVASSTDGTKLVAVNGWNYYNPIYTSTNSGITWTQASTPFTAAGGEVSPSQVIASSADGAKLVAALHATPVYISTDSGNSWTLTSAPNINWQSVASSADGTKLVAAVDGGQIYTSTNSGNTWTSNNVPNQYWTSVASSADGNELVAAVLGGGIWISQTTPSPQLNLAPTNPDFKLSWLVPSTNFVLQQSLDLSSWTDVTNTPALNLTDLQNEVVLSPTNSSGFYRLKTP